MEKLGNMSQKRIVKEQKRACLVKRRLKKVLVLCLGCLLLCLAGCKKDKGFSGFAGSAGPTGFIPINATLPEGSDLPGLNIQILRITGGTGPNGNFQAGDYISVTFRITNDQGTLVPLGELDYGAIMVSGPTFNYQRVIPLQTNLLVQSYINPDDTWTYTFSTPIPATYLPPINDTPVLDIKDSELQGHALFSGTYTVGIEAYKIYSVGQNIVKDVANATADFLYGTATVIESREAVLESNCNQCHGEVRAHGGIRRKITLCLLCHTAGSEDNNDPNIEGGTPGVSIEFRVMIHKIHNGAHLPSVQGVTTNPDGSRNYNAPPKAYRIVDGDGNIHDFSSVEFPAWPGASYPMPKDAGYSALSSAAQAKEDIIRTGVTDCDKCHGGAAQGALAYQILSRNACGACHDDIRWDYNYTSNGQTMPPMPRSYACQPCHPESGTPLALRDAHTHPMKKDARPNLQFVLSNLTEAGANNGDNTIDPGEKISITFTIQDENGQNVSPADLSAARIALTGPVVNRNLVLYTSLPLAALTGSPPYTILVPERVYYEFVGDSTATTGDTFTTGRAPHWNVTGGKTQVYLRTGSGVSTTLSSNALAGQNYLILASVAGLNNGDFIVVEDGVAGKEEYLRIRWIDTSSNRVWFGSPYTDFGAYPPVRYDHASGVSVQQVTLTAKTEGPDYSINGSTGTITEVSEFGAGTAVIVSYTTDFVMPSKYPLVLNDTGAFDETWGKWTGKSIVSGTYTLGIWGYRTYTLTIQGENNTYIGASESATRDFLVGSATALQTNDIISSENNCKSCHSEIVYHGGTRRGLKTCFFCHGGAGAEDRALYDQTVPDPANKATVETTIDFRTMVHKIHRGSGLSQSLLYKVVGYGDKVHTYEKVKFPMMVGGVKNCSKCHGTGSTTTWEEPKARIHPTEQVQPAREWRAVCGACHDSLSAQSHILLMTQGGSETCALCHGKGKTENVQLKHKSW